MSRYGFSGDAIVVLGFRIRSHSHGPITHAHPHIVPAAFEAPIVVVLDVLLFGLGSVVGMALMSALCSLPLAAITRRFDRAERAVRITAGLTSIAFGVAMVIEIGFVDGRRVAR